MDYKYYEKKVNDVIMKCPIEAGIEVLVYNLLDNIIESEEMSLVEINRLRKDRDDRLTTDTGIPDIAILSEDFEYKTDIGQVYGFVEVKTTNVALIETEQICGQKAKAPHYIYTNGLEWKYFYNGECQWAIILAYFKNNQCKKIDVFQRVSIDANKFSELMEELNKIIWK